MKKLLPFLVLAAGLGYLLAGLRPVVKAEKFDLVGFGQLPVLVNGRLKPLDTVARNTLLVIQSRQRVSTPEQSTPFAASPTEWLAQALFSPATADTFPTIKIDSPEVLSLVGITEADTRIAYDSGVKRAMAILGFLPSTKSRFSYQQLQSQLTELDRQARLAEGIEPQLRTTFQRQLLNVRNHLVLYLQLKTSLQIPESKDFAHELELFEKALPTGIRAILALKDQQPYDRPTVEAMKVMADRFSYMEQLGYLRVIPPAGDDKTLSHWRSAGSALMESFGTAKIDPTVMNYARLGQAWRTNDTATFNRIVAEMHADFAARFPAELHKSDIEQRFNHAEPFYRSMTLYIWAFLFAAVSWLFWPDLLRRGAFWLLTAAFVGTSAGILARMWIGGYAPVTNLYSSALFVAWGAVALCLILELVFKNAIGTAAGGLIGFVALIIAHFLSLDSADTMEMMRAVLDSNIWLSTHVVIITLGYAATFLAGFLALIYVFRGLLTTSLDRKTADSLQRMVYGIVCFATLFSLIGTILGGIWADQSWGRFWGWDPKENGALIIVIWNAVILHARWGGMIKQRGLMLMAVFGNIVTSWSWFGTNMLGVGLHSYGFMDAAFWALLSFVTSQLLVIALGGIPLEKWRSFRSAANPPAA